jgi:Predicted phosphohydrolases
MKRIISILTVFTLCICLIIPSFAADAYSAGLKFKSDGTFKIVQVADLQEFVLSSTITHEFLYDIVVNESPDLFVLSGDNVSTMGAAVFPKPIAEQLVKLSVDNVMKIFDKIYAEFGIPVTMVYGNHDNEVGSYKVSRADQFAMYAAHPSFIGYYIPEADENTSDIFGQHYGTHNLIVNDSTGINPIFNVWMFDSGSYESDLGYSCVKPSQIEWFKKTNEEINRLPSVVFQHIIVKEIDDILVDDRLPSGAIGVKRQATGNSNKNYGHYDALNNSGNVLAMFFGHDHLNNFQIMLDGTDLVATACTGFGSYGTLDLRGVRVITLSESDLTTYDTYNVTYRDYYSLNLLDNTRVHMFQLLGTLGVFLDRLLFEPITAVADLFEQMFCN